MTIPLHKNSIQPDLTQLDPIQRDPIQLDPTQLDPTQRDLVQPNITQMAVTEREWLRGNGSGDRRPGSAVVFCTAMRWEAAALRRGLGPAHRGAVVCTGVGPRRTRRAAATPPVSTAGAVVMTGIAGGLDPSLSPGDIVVADRVIGVPGRNVQSDSAGPAARLLAARLRNLGLTVRVGPIATADHLITGAQRHDLADAGAIAVDMETGYLLPDGRPNIAVRVVADVAGEPLLRPATLGRVRKSLRTITAMAPALADWADAVADRNVLLAEPRSFCGGVERAIEVGEQALREVAAKSDLVLVVGSKKSHTGRRLVAAAERFGAAAHLVDDVDDLDLRWLAGVRTVGLTAGASGPAALVEEIIVGLSGLGRVDVQTRQLVTEDVRFTLSKEVRGA